MLCPSHTIPVHIDRSFCNANYSFPIHPLPCSSLLSPCFQSMPSTSSRPQPVPTRCTDTRVLTRGVKRSFHVLELIRLMWENQALFSDGACQSSLYHSLWQGIRKIGHERKQSMKERLHVRKAGQPLWGLLLTEREMFCDQFTREKKRSGREELGYAPPLSSHKVVIHY